MGKKYVVELGRCERLYKASVNVNGKPNMTWLSPEVDLNPTPNPTLSRSGKRRMRRAYPMQKKGKQRKSRYRSGMKWKTLRLMPDL